MRLTLIAAATAGAAIAVPAPAQGSFQSRLEQGSAADFATCLSC